MPHTFSLENTFGAGQRLQSDLAGAAQAREFNSLRATGERQRQDLQRRTFDADTQRANSEKLLAGFQIMRNNPGSTPDVLEELGNNGIINRASIPDMLREATTSPQTFQQKMADAESKIRLQLGQARPQPTFGAPRAGIDPTTGESVFGQIDPATGQSRTVEGLAPPTGSAVGDPSAVRLFNELSEAAAEVGLDGQPTQRAIQAQTQLGTRARAGTTSSRERIATDEGLTEAVAESEATIAQRKKFAELTGASRAKLIDKGFEAIQKIDINTRNLGKAIDAIDEGAQTGAIISRFTPTIRAATVKLEQIQKLLGLDVIGAVTFGALSKGELDLALETALPTNLSAPELKQWLLDKQAANSKLRDYFSSQIEFVDQGGTLAGFLRQQGRQGQQGNVIDFADLPP